jgi:manganese oxidase
MIRMRVCHIELRFIGTDKSFTDARARRSILDHRARSSAVVSGARYLADSVNVGPGQRYDVIWTAQGPGICRVYG